MHNRHDSVREQCGDDNEDRGISEAEIKEREQIASLIDEMNSGGNNQSPEVSEQLQDGFNMEDNSL